MSGEFNPRGRIIRILLALLEQQNGYTKKQLADRFKIHKDRIKDDIEILNLAGFLIEQDSKYRYLLRMNKPYQQLKDLLHFSEEDQFLLHQAIDKIAKTRRAERLKKKLASLYDYHRLGHAYLRKPYLKKVDLLVQAKNEKRVVILKPYRSSSGGDIRNRIVEPFHISPPEDSLHAFDNEKNELRHFRISRITRVKLTDSTWQNEGKHYVKQTDPFRINDDKQIPVHIRFRVGGYNELIERFPLTEPYIEHDAEDNIYDFQCLVNSNFKGLTNFILGSHHELIEIITPESLIDHIQNEVKKIQEKLNQF